MYAAQYATIIAVFLHLGTKQLKFRIGIYIAFLGSFATWCLLSIFWAHDAERALAGALGIAHFVILGTAVAAYVVAERATKFLLNCLAWSAFGLVVVLVVVTPPHVWSEAIAPTVNASSDENRLGYTVAHHPNALARVVAVGAYIWIYKVVSERTHVLAKTVVIFALVAVLILTKSRLSVALFVLIVLLFLLLTSRNIAKLTFRVTVALILLGLALWALLNVPVLYDTVGFRFLAMFGFGGEVDASTSTRAEMTRIALELFSRNPILGVGFENFSYYYYNYYFGWAATYAHNTYAELLSDLGIVGIITYYGVPAWAGYVLFRRLRPARNKADLMVPFLFVLAASQLLADMASISYTSDFVQLVTVLVFSGAIIDDSGVDSARKLVDSDAGERAKSAPSC